MNEPLPAGFREDTGSGSGLIVPEALSRKREVITQAEWKKIRGAIEHVCRPHNLKFVRTASTFSAAVVNCTTIRKSNG